MQEETLTAGTGVQRPVSPDPHLLLVVQTKPSWYRFDEIDELRYMLVLNVEED